MGDSTSYDDSNTEYLAESQMKSENNVSGLLNVIGANVELMHHHRGSNLDFSKTLDKSLRRLSSNNRRNDIKKFRSSKRASKSNSKGKRRSKDKNHSYLQATVSSKNKNISENKENLDDSATRMNKLENIFFTKKDQRNLLTESDLRDSNIQLTGESMFVNKKRNNKYTELLDKGNKLNTKFRF